MRYTLYLRMKDSGIEWLGEAPDHWRVCRLGSCFIERREKVSDKEFLPLSVTMNGVVPQLETAAKTDDGDNRKRVEVGDFVINSRSDRRGSSGLSSLRGSVSLINTVLRPVGVNGRFAHHLLRSEPFIDEYYRLGKGIVADLWSTNYSQMKLISLALPPLDEQQAIADFLDAKTSAIDAVILKKERLIEQLQERRQAIITQAVTKGLDLTVPMKESGIEWLGEIPAHWEVKPIKHLATFVSGGTPSKANLEFWDGPIPWLSAKDLKQDYLDDSEDHISDFARREAGLKIIPEEAVILVVRGMILARTLPVSVNTAPVTINQDLKALLPGSCSVGRFLAWQLRGLASAFLSRTDTAGHGTKTLRTEDWNDFSLACPPVAEQQAIAQYLDERSQRFEQLSQQIERQIATLRDYRQAIITAAVTGKIDVRDWLERVDPAAKLAGVPA
jgi:type I restriction enzyme S subunit